MKGKVISVQPVFKADGGKLTSKDGNVKYDVTVEMGGVLRALVAWGGVGEHLVEGETYDFEIKVPKPDSKYQDWTITAVEGAQDSLPPAKEEPKQAKEATPVQKKAEFRDPAQIIRSTAIGVAANIIAAVSEKSGQIHTKDLFELAKKIETYVTTGKVTEENDELISEAQAKRLWALTKKRAEEIGLTHAEAEEKLREIAHAAGYESLKHIRRGDYELICDTVANLTIDPAKEKETQKS